MRTSSESPAARAPSTEKEALRAPGVGAVRVDAEPRGLRVREAAVS